MTIVRLEDTKSMDICHHGIRLMCEANEVDWLDFLQNGIDVERIKHIDDVYVKQAIKNAEAREKGTKA